MKNPTARRDKLRSEERGSVRGEFVILLDRRHRSNLRAAPPDPGGRGFPDFSRSLFGEGGLSLSPFPISSLRCAPLAFSHSTPATTGISRAPSGFSGCTRASETHPTWRPPGLYRRVGNRPRTTLTVIRWRFLSATVQRIPRISRCD